jgi:hypothetical protein
MVRLRRQATLFFLLSGKPSMGMLYGYQLQSKIQRLALLCFARCSAKNLEASDVNIVRWQLADHFLPPITNAVVVRRYSRRWLVEKAISEQIEFFHLNRLSSSIVIKVDFDLKYLPTTSLGCWPSKPIGTNN